MTTYVWIPESPSISAYYAAAVPKVLWKLGEKGIEYGTFSAHEALHFVNYNDCVIWCNAWNEEQLKLGHTGMFIQRQHGFD